MSAVGGSHEGKREWWRPLGRGRCGVWALLFVATASVGCSGIGESAMGVDRRESEDEPVGEVPTAAGEHEEAPSASDVDGIDVGPTDLFPQPTMELVWVQLEAQNFEAAKALMDSLSEAETKMAPEGWLLARALLLLDPANPEADSAEARELLEELVALDLPAARKATLRTLVAMVDSRGRWRAEALQLRRTLEAMRAIDLEEPPP